ncbi:STAS domain-containing protein [Streptomyces violaceolatus]|uniref:STAS domain-containing protein n=1 Tax=Streptomyces violaceolatus TaxID=67378 RepID=A0ABN3TAS4_9ACTN
MYVWEGSEVSLHKAVTGCTDAADVSRPQDLDQASVVLYERCGVPVVGVCGEYDLHSITPLSQALGTAAREHTKVVLEASGITFADSALLNLLILTQRSVDLRVAAPARQLRRLLEITGVDAVLKVRSTVEEAATC